MHAAARNQVVSAFIALVLLSRGAPASTAATGPNTGPRLYVLSAGNSTVSVITLSDNQVVATLGVGHDNWGAAISPDGAWLCVTNHADGTVSAISTVDSQVTTIGVAYVPTSVAVSPDSKRA